MSGKSILALMLSAGLALAGGPGAAVGEAGDAVRPQPPQAGVTLRNGGPLSAYRAVSNSDVFENSSSAYFEIADMRLPVRAARNSRMVITLSAECRATPDVPGEPVSAMVMILVNSRTMPSMRRGGRLTFCSSGASGWESQSFQWVSAPVNRRRSVVSVWLARSFAGPGTVALGDRVLTVLYEPR